MWVLFFFFFPSNCSNRWNNKKGPRKDGGSGGRESEDFDREDYDGFNDG